MKHGQKVHSFVMANLEWKKEGKWFSLTFDEWSCLDMFPTTYFTRHARCPSFPNVLGIPGNPFSVVIPGNKKPTCGCERLCACLTYVTYSVTYCCSTCGRPLARGLGPDRTGYSLQSSWACTDPFLAELHYVYLLVVCDVTGQNSRWTCTAQ